MVHAGAVPPPGRRRVDQRRVHRVRQAPRLRDRPRGTWALCSSCLRRVGMLRLVSAALVSGVPAVPGRALRRDHDSWRHAASLASAGRGRARRPIGGRGGQLICAGALCALAISAKLTAVWAPVALVLWLFVRERKRLPAFALSFAMSLPSSCWVPSSSRARGRMSETLLAVGGPGQCRGVLSRSQGFRAPVRLRRQHHRAVLAATSRSCLIGYARALSTRRLTLYQLCLLVAVPLLALVLADPGSDFNHLVDLVALTLLVVGEEWRNSGTAGRRGAPNRHGRRGSCSAAQTPTASRSRPTPPMPPSPSSDARRRPTQPTR